MFLRDSTPAQLRIIARPAEVFSCRNVPEVYRMENDMFVFLLDIVILLMYRGASISLQRLSPHSVYLCGASISAGKVPRIACKPVLYRCR